MFVGDSWFPDDQQDLLDYYVRTQLSEIGEFSYGPENEARDLRKWAELYAQKNGLKVPSADGYWSNYLPELRG